MHFRHQDQQGFIILFAIVVSAIMALVAAGIFSLSLKELELSTSSRESMEAFYAADSGLECAFYADLKSLNLSGIQGGDVLDCFGEDVDVESIDVDVFGFTLEIDTPGGEACSQVLVRKSVELDDVQNSLATEIISRGFNTCRNGVPRVSDPFLVERRLRAWYPEFQAAPVPSPDPLPDEG